MAVDLTASITQLGLMGTPTRWIFAEGGIVPPPLPPYTPPTTVRIYGYFSDPSGDLLEGLSIVFTTAEKIESGSVVIQKGQKEETTTDANGYFQVDLTVGLYNLSLIHI